jgi:hypothetical protein
MGPFIRGCFDTGKSYTQIRRQADRMEDDAILPDAGARIGLPPLLLPHDSRPTPPCARRSSSRSWRPPQQLNHGARRSSSTMATACCLSLPLRLVNLNLGSAFSLLPQRRRSGSVTSSSAVPPQPLRPLDP